MAQRVGPRHFRFDEWSRGRSGLHRLDARWKLAAALALLAASSLWDRAWLLALLFPLLAWLARLPAAALALRAALVLPFSLVFAGMSWLAGDPARALLLFWKPWVSALWAVLLMATTPLEEVLSAAARFGAPSLLLEVMHFLWRYLGVLVEQAQRLRMAALARGAERSFEISASSAAVLLASSFARASRIHRAMLARGAGGPP
ncbi:MAG: energy-coupling factor transporter transmembrane protein EcfT [Bryobacteraceae bacterium]|nr:energy-coupling factor transporter transmembrane protein EcfT [Bryobacteraceae bacterium]